METLFIVLAMLAMVAFVVGLIMLLIRGRRRRGWRVLLVSFLVFFVSVIAHTYVGDRNARAQGFLDLRDRQIAEEFGYTDALAWAGSRDELLAARQERLERKAEASRVAHENAQARREEERRAEEQRRLREEQRRLREERRAAERRAAEALAKAQEQERAEAEQEAQEAEERRKGFHCLSTWDGSHRELARTIIDSLNNPRSFSHVETGITPVRENGTHGLYMKFRAENAYGAIVLNHVGAQIRQSDCAVLEWEWQ